MKQAIVAVEDRRFFEHRGVDVRGIVRAVWQDFREQGVVEGGSTITQQFVKNAYVHSSARGAEAEGGGARLAARAALAQGPDPHRVPQHDLLRQRRLRHRAGVARLLPATRRPADARGVGAARGIPPTRRCYDPVANPQRARARRKIVLRAMLEQGGDHAGRVQERERTPLPDPASIHLPGIQGPAPYFTNYVKQQLIDTYGTARSSAAASGCDTSIDLDLQDMAREAIAKWLPDPNGPAAALVAIDPRDGRVLAMVGGQELQREPVQPRRPGRAAARVVVQADRARGRARPGHLARRRRSSQARSRSRSATATGTSRTTRARTSARSTSRRRRCTPTTRSTRS